MTQIPITTSGVRCLVTNISNENVEVSGIRILAGAEVDLFEEDPLLTESEVLGWMQNSFGPLYIETTISNRLRIVDVDFESIPSPNLIYGNSNKVVFKRSRDDLIEEIAPVHIPIATAAGVRGAGVKDPSLAEIGNFLVSAFTVDQDQAHKIIKVPLNYIDSGAIHIHWTKSQDTDQSNNRVLWRVSYTVIDGYSDTTEANNAIISTEETYIDNGTITHVVYRTSDLYLDGNIEVGKYISFKIEAITPSQNTLAEPALVSIDFTYNGLINRNPFDMDV